MTKVLHLFPFHEIGGAENVILNLIRYRQRRDIAHTLADAIRTVFNAGKGSRSDGPGTPARMVERIETGLLTLKTGAGRRR